MQVRQVGGKTCQQYVSIIHRYVAEQFFQFSQQKYSTVIIFFYKQKQKGDFKRCVEWTFTVSLIKYVIIEEAGKSAVEEMQVWIFLFPE